MTRGWFFGILEVSMAKQKKKRTKIYRGADASMTRPTVTRITAANRNAINQWWFEKKRIAKPVLIASAVVIAVILLLVELVRVIGGSVA
jgi:hypothetical protein